MKESSALLGVLAVTLWSGGVGYEVPASADAALIHVTPVAHSFAEVGQPNARLGRLRQLRGFGGGVTDVGADWLDIRETGKPPRRILAGGTVPGGDESGPGYPDTYRPIDLKIGDVVALDTGVVGGDEITLRISIVRRPGGKIPRLPGEMFPERDTELHVRNQAEQDWEEKGIPIPARFCDANGQVPWTNPPYPSTLAPMPREVRSAKP